MTTVLALELRQHLALVSTGLISESEAAALREDTWPTEIAEDDEDDA
jgi:hypothetical protein